MRGLRLTAVFEINQELEKLQTKLTVYRQLATDVKISDMQKIRTKSQTSRTEYIAVKITDLEKEIKQKLEERATVREELTKRLEEEDIPAVIFSIFYMRYVGCVQWKDIAETVGYSETHVFLLHRKWKGRLLQ